MLSAARIAASSRVSARTFASLRDKVKTIRPEELYEPVIVDKRIYPEYDQINVRLQAYDYALIEAFQGYVHKISKRFGSKVLESYAVAARTENVVVYKRGTAIPESTNELALYDRWVRIQGVQAIKLPIFMNLLRTHVPIGVTISISEFTKEDENFRYIPDLDLKDKQEELKSLDNPLVRKALGWE